MIILRHSVLRALNACYHQNFKLCFLDYFEGYIILEQLPFGGPAGAKNL